jgi:hypothetical protein
LVVLPEHYPTFAIGREPVAVDEATLKLRGRRSGEFKRSEHRIWDGCRHRSTFTLVQPIQQSA